MFEINDSVKFSGHYMYRSEDLFGTTGMVVEVRSKPVELYEAGPIFMIRIDVAPPTGVYVTVPVKSKDLEKV